MAARKRNGKARMAWVRSFRKNAKQRKSHSRKRNPYPMAGVALNSRQRKKSHGRRRNPWGARVYSKTAGYVHAKRRRRNPSMTKILGVEMPPLQAVLWAGVGFIAPQPVEAWLNANIIPASLSTNPIGKYVVRIGSVLGLSWIVKQVMGSSEARMVGIGGGAYVLISALKEFAPGMLPGTAAYVLPGAPGLSAYVPSSSRQLSAGGVPVFGAAKQNNVSRFSRFANR